MSTPGYRRNKTRVIFDKRRLEMTGVKVHILPGGQHCEPSNQIYARCLLDESSRNGRPYGSPSESQSETTFPIG
jgi:hypothetical protein